MLTPNFEIEQTDSTITFLIRAPYADLETFDVSVDGFDFIFYCTPYYLRLSLPGPVEETESSKGKYDPDKGTFILTVEKVNKGEHFPDLDLMTALLAPRKADKNLVKPIIEVVESQDKGADEDEDLEEDCNEWFIEQNPLAEPPESVLLQGPQYGFANKTSAALYNFTMEFSDVLNLPSPDSTPVAQRSLLREKTEAQDFSDDHYLADWAEEDVVKPILDFNPVWEDLKPENVKLTSEEKEIIKDLPNKEYLLDSKERNWVTFSLVDILFGYAYNVRATLGEDSVESAWTINKISATLSWLQSYDDLRSVAKCCVRRSLTYPLYRNWNLSMKVLDDVCNILSLGRRQVLKCLLEIRKLFINSEPRYILNQLYINDYCVWIQQTSDKRLLKLAEALQQVGLEKASVHLDLEELESAALSTLAEEETAKNSKAAQDLSNAVFNLKIQNSDSESTYDSSSDSESDTSSSDSESDSSESGTSGTLTDSDDVSSDDEKS